MEYEQKLIVILNYYFKKFGSKGKGESRENEKVKWEALEGIGMNNIWGQRNKTREQTIKDSTVKSDNQ